LPAEAPPIPLARWADRQLRVLAAGTGSERIAALDGPTLLGERGSNGGYTINGTTSAGLGGSRLLPTRGGQWFALSLIRDVDRDLLPALFGDAAIDTRDWQAIARAVSQRDCAELLARGRDLGLPVASANEAPASLAIELLTEGARRDRPQGHRPLVIDLSAIWAGPLAGHLLWLAGCEVVKVESLTRPDLIRRDDPATFDLINQGKASIVVAFANGPEKAALTQLIRRADLVIESSRPRALRQFGIDADALVRETPGLVWLSVTGHGARGEAAMWTGIGNDCGVAGGLSRAMADAGGEIGFVGDAIADPLTGITAALNGRRAYRSGKAQRLGFAMSAITAQALAEERAFDTPAVEAELRAWSAAQGLPFAKVSRRPMYAKVRDFGADTAGYLPGRDKC
jgi:CoA-transferase family III